MDHESSEFTQTVGCEFWEQKMDQGILTKGICSAFVGTCSSTTHQTSAIQLMSSSKSQLYSVCPSGTVDVNVCCVAFVDDLYRPVECLSICSSSVEVNAKAVRTPSCLRSQISTYCCWH
ncbi:hypothetical protein KIL84_021686 [Mauremys mutica]|uniref:Uncharacterized protein n=1 Tax=Mauremys mutica TaxID=74926 RepID=A0A9D4AT55_9SAUR|nr:hypothetical protein KIL84_021686 [Mauremys mutica]